LRRIKINRGVTPFQDPIATPSNSDATSFPDDVGESDRLSNLASQLLAQTREELDRADGKASILLAGTGVAVGAIVGAILSGDWTPSRLRPPAELIWWLGVACTAISIIRLAQAVYPRSKRRGLNPDVIGFYGDVVVVPAAELEGALARTVAAGRAYLVDQLRTVSSIVDRKYRYVRHGLWLLAAGIVLCCVAMFENWLIS
jgi:hypothetical protein